jgi:uncharacterized protein involved in exopolysaccharide biosynthesis
MIAATIGIVLVWMAAGAYLKLSPRAYTSGFVLVLPGTGAGSSLNLESIGSASSTTAPAFSSPDLSPTENYRKILLSHRLLTAAGLEAGEDPDRFPTPKIELADQTKLITVSVTGPSPEVSTGRAEAIRTTFRIVLDSLRQDEISQRDRTFQEILTGYKSRLQDGRQRLIDQQARSGLVSVEQYGTIVATVERLHEQQRDIETKLALGRTTVTELTRLLGVTAEQATTAMILRSDPLFQTLLDSMAKQDTELATLSGVRGETNPRLLDARAERDSVLSKLAERGVFLTGLKRADLLKLRDVSLRDERARLFERLVSQVAETNALGAVQRELATQITNEQQRVMRLANDVSRIENLRRDVQVAEAVFTSALARIDTSKADYFASYPMVQTFEAPLMPVKPSSPLPILAIGGGLGATFLILAALVLSWLRITLFQKILKNA